MIKRPNSLPSLWLLNTSIILLLLFSSAFAAGGKISGKVIDAATKEALPGADVIVVESMKGTATHVDGSYFILNLRPGIYTLECHMMGYGKLVKENIFVTSNRTSMVNFELNAEIIEGQTVIVDAARSMIQTSVSSSQHIISAAAIQTSSLDNMEEIISSEAGISLSAGDEGSGIQVRGGNINEVNILVDGISTRNARNQQPNTNINLTAIQEIEIVTGGFSAEYGEIRSGVINVVAREGKSNKYSLNVDFRGSPAAPKHFGPSPFGIQGPYWQVYAGKDAMDGVFPGSELYDEYGLEFMGWKAISESMLTDGDDSNDMTPQQLLEEWKWQHRDRPYADKPDYIFDGTFTGPVPFLPLTFILSQRYENLQLVYPMSRNNSIASTSMFNLVYHINSTMTLKAMNLYMYNAGVSGSRGESTFGLVNGTREGVKFGQRMFSWSSIWVDAAYNPAVSNQYQGGLTLNHVLSENTFYDLSLQYFDYATVQEPQGIRDTTGIKQIGDLWYDETPFGYFHSDLGNISSRRDRLDQFYISTGGRGQDHSSYKGMSIKWDIVSQVTTTNQIKVGLMMDYTQFKERREVNNGKTTQTVEEKPQDWFYYDADPLKLSGYFQDRYELGTVVGNFGVRFDYLNPRTDTYNLDPEYIFLNLPYDLDNYEDQGRSFDEQLIGKADAKLYVSPRFGISHPVSVNSKIYFNYGHFYQPPVTDRLFLVKPDDNEAMLPNHNAEWPLTISYEFGWEQRFFGEYLFSILGYYKDISGELRQQTIESYYSESVVETWANNRYADIRGLELQLRKRPGGIMYGYLSLDYMAKTVGYTGLAHIYENRQMALLEKESSTPVNYPAVPSVNANVTFVMPDDFGPDLMGFYPIGGWRLNVNQRWSDGGRTLFNSDANLEARRWMEVIDYWNTDLLIEKDFISSKSRFSVYMQVKNLTNYRGAPRALSSTDYKNSLHFPWEQGSQHGNDKYGEWDKDYIYLGHNTYQHWVNPRDIFIGIKLKL